MQKSHFSRTSFDNFQWVFISKNLDPMILINCQKSALTKKWRSLRLISQENIENIEFKVEVKRTKLPIAIKIPIMIAGFGESLSAPLVSSWLFFVMNLIFFLMIVSCLLTDIRNLWLVSIWPATWTLSSFGSTHLCHELYIG